MKTAIQQFQLRNHLKSMKEAKETLQAVREAGFTGIELNGFMLRPLSLPIRLLCQMAGMGMGKSDRLDWEYLIKESQLEVVALHEDLNRILQQPDAVAADAKRFGTRKIVLTGMRKYDYTTVESVCSLAQQCNLAAEQLQQRGLQFFYHNHNCEFQRMDNQQIAYERLLEETNSELVRIEFDSFWASEAGVDVGEMMQKLGSRFQLYHLTDRGIRPQGASGSILKADCLELGLGNAPIDQWMDIAEKAPVDAIIIETHRNWIHHSAIESLQISGKYLQQFERK